MSTATAPPCGDALGKGVARGESKGYVVAWRADPSPIVVSRHFALDVVVESPPFELSRNASSGSAA